MHQLRIVDAGSLQHVLERVKELRGGTDRSAAEALGLEQSTFTRLRSGATSQFLQWPTYSAIRTALEGHAIEFGLIDLFEGSVLSAEGQFVLGHYQEWARTERRRLEFAGAHEVFTELWAVPQCRRWFVDQILEPSTGDRGLPPEDRHRVWIALYRVVEDLVAAEATWGVELSWRELRDREARSGINELRFFVKWASKLQGLLLRRDAELERIRRAGLKPPESYLADLAGVHDDA